MIEYSYIIDGKLFYIYCEQNTSIAEGDPESGSHEVSPVLRTSFYDNDIEDYYEHIIPHCHNGGPIIVPDMDMKMTIEWRYLRPSKPPTFWKKARKLLNAKLNISLDY